MEQVEPIRPLFEIIAEALGGQFGLPPKSSPGVNVSRPLKSAIATSEKHTEQRRLLGWVLNVEPRVLVSVLKEFQQPHLG